MCPSYHHIQQKSQITTTKCQSHPRSLLPLYFRRRLLLIPLDIPPTTERSGVLLKMVSSLWVRDRIFSPLLMGFNQSLITTVELLETTQVMWLTDSSNHCNNISILGARSRGRWKSSNWIQMVIISQVIRCWVFVSKWLNGSDILDDRYVGHKTSKQTVEKF